MNNSSESDNYSNYRGLACAIIHAGITQYKKALYDGTNLSKTRMYLNNRFYTILVQVILDSTVDEMLDNVEENYQYTKAKRYNKGILYGKAEKNEKHIVKRH